MEEIGRHKQTVHLFILHSMKMRSYVFFKIVNHELTLSTREKEIKFLKRSLESVYIRLNANQETSEQQTSLLNAEEMAAKSMDALNSREDTINQLRADVVSLKQKLKKAQSQSSRVYKGPAIGLEDIAKLQIRQAPAPPVAAPVFSTSTDVDNGEGPPTDRQTSAVAECKLSDRC